MDGVVDFLAGCSDMMGKPLTSDDRLVTLNMITEKKS